MRETPARPVGPDGPSFGPDAGRFPGTDRRLAERGVGRFRRAVSEKRWRWFGGADAALAATTADHEAVSAVCAVPGRDGGVDVTRTETCVPVEWRVRTDWGTVDAGPTVEGYREEDIDVGLLAAQHSQPFGAWRRTVAGRDVVGTRVVVPLVDELFERRGLDEHARKPLRLLVRAGLLLAAVGLAFALAGYGSVLLALATVGAAATLAIGFAMQDVIKNSVVGVFIYTDRPFRTGDRIEWEDNSGFVEDIGLRVTRVRTFDNEHLTVPNSQLTDGVIKNYDHNRTLRLKFTFRIGLHDDIDAATTSSSRRPGGRRASWRTRSRRSSSSR